MSHHIYTTRAFVVSSRPLGESNRMFTLLTDELGMVTAAAQGVRLEKSKLRYSLQDYRQILVSLVRGREIWRIVGAEEVRDFTPPSLEVKTMLARLARFLGQFIHGEGRVGTLFSDIEAVLQLWPQLGNPTLRGDLEAILMLRALHYLGYLESRVSLNTFTKEDVDEGLVRRFAPVRTEAISLIDQAVMGSQL